MADRRTTVWQDAGGRTSAHLLTTSGGAAAVEAALAAKSNAGVLLSWEGALTVGAPAPVNAPYPDVQDVALLVYSTAGGTLVKVALPAPQASIFMADGVTVDPAQIGAITAAIIANVVTAGGAAVTAYVGGTRAPRT